MCDIIVSTDDSRTGIVQIVSDFLYKRTIVNYERKNYGVFIKKNE